MKISFFYLKEKLEKKNEELSKTAEEEKMKNKKMIQKFKKIQEVSSVESDRKIAFFVRKV